MTSTDDQQQQQQQFIAKIAELLEPSPEGLERLPDDQGGSIVMLTIMDPATATPVVSFVQPRDGPREYVTRRAIQAGQMLFEEAPALCVALGPPDEAQALYPQDAKTVEAVMRADPDLRQLSPVLEWIVTYLLLAGDDLDGTMRRVSSMPQPDRYSRAAVFKEMLARKIELPAVARAWIGCLMRKTAGRLTLDELLLVFGSVSRNLCWLRSPWTGSEYAAGLYPGAAHIGQQCGQPAVRFEYRTAGVLRVTAARDLPAGTRLTTDRPGTQSFFRCLQTAPPWVREAWDSSAGARCPCPECEATLAWLRQAGTPDEGLSPEKADAIVAIVNGLWTHREPEARAHLCTGLKKRVTERLRSVLEHPFIMARLETGHDLALAIRPAQVRAMCSTDLDPAREGKTGPSLASLSVCQALLMCCVEAPGRVVAWAKEDAKKDGQPDDLVRMLVGHWVYGGALKMVSLLGQQHADQDQTGQRVRRFHAASRFLAFAAWASFCIFAVRPTAGAATTTTATVRDAAKALDARPEIRALLHGSWSAAVALEGGTEEAAKRVVEAFDLENQLFPAVGMAIMICSEAPGKYASAE